MAITIRDGNENLYPPLILNKNNMEMVSHDKKHGPKDLNVRPIFHHNKSTKETLDRHCCYLERCHETCQRTPVAMFELLLL